MTEVRFSGSSAEQAEDFRAAAAAAKAAREGTDAGDLGARGRDYLKALEVIAPAYEDAGAAAAKRDREAFDRALDLAEPTDEALDTFADGAGLTRCSLDEPRAGRESRVSQSGFPALIVPKGRRVPPSASGKSQVYPFGQDEAITLLRGPKIPSGTVPSAEAVKIFETPRDPGYTTLEQTGTVGDEQVPMRAYRYEQDLDKGTLATFSGQGHVWLLVCASRRPGGQSQALKSACSRAAETAGFLMF